MFKEKYSEKSIQSLDWKEHIRLRPGMYIGKLGDGNMADDGIYILLKEVIDNSIDEYVMGHGKQIHITHSENTITVRDYGRGIPLGKVVDCVSKINTGGKYDSKAFQKSVGLNGVGLKAVNALSEHFEVCAYRDGQMKKAIFSRGNLVHEEQNISAEENGTQIGFKADNTVFKNFSYNEDFIREQLWNYACLNTGLGLYLNKEKFSSSKGLKDLLEKRITHHKLAYPLIHFRSKDIELAFTHTQQSGETYYSFVNGQYTPQGGTHLNAFREVFIKVIRDHFNKNFDSSDIRNALCVALSVRIEEPVFESQTKTKLGSLTASPDGISLRVFYRRFLKG